MELYILDKNYEILGVIDAAESILWNPKYDDVGEAEIYTPCSEEYLELLKIGHYIYRYDDEMFCKIHNIKIETDVEGGDYIIATAKDICTLLSGRIVRWSITYSGRLAVFIQKVLESNAVGTWQEKRLIPNLTIDTSNFDELTEMVERTAFIDDLLELIKTTCKAHGYGFRVSFDIDSKQLVFKLYDGKNKAIAGDEYVEFSPDFANILSSEYEEDDSNYKNVVYVSYINELENLQLLSMYKGDTEPTGEARREMFVDGTGLSRDITLDELEQIYDTLTKQSTTTEDGVTSVYYYGDIAVAKSEGEGEDESISITDYTLLLFVRALGQTTLDEQTETQVFSGEVDTLDSYVYKVDYNIGDIVKVVNDYGIEAEARIVEVMESEDDNGYVVEPKYEYINFEVIKEGE